MKKRKSALGLATIITLAGVLTGCNNTVTPAENGDIITYTDAQGKVQTFNASQLLESYQKADTSAATEFDKVYEVLIRKYYDDPTRAEKKKSLESKARIELANSQQRAQDNAEKNKTTYQEEFETILKARDCNNIDELFKYHLYQEEKKDYEQTYYNKNRDAMRDGSTKGLESNDLLFKKSDKYGRENKGWLREELPYHIRHILVKVSAEGSDFTQGKLSESTDNTAGEATKLASTIFALAGADVLGDGTTAAKERDSFGSIAKSRSDDEGSAQNFGEIGLMTARTGQGINYVPEFRLGTYAFESLYSGQNDSKYFKENVNTITPGMTKDGTSVDEHQKLDDTGKTVNEFFKEKGVGTIPYGAAVALMKVAKTTKDANDEYVNKANRETFYPRNVIFNKYFNRHNVCVITPNDIPFNMPLEDAKKALEKEFAPETLAGVPNATYANLPGFKNKVKLKAADGSEKEQNVLTDEEGRVILAVRAGTSAYQGIHFIIVQRSGLDLWGGYANAKQENVASLDQYYVLGKVPNESGYPTKADGKPMETYINYNKQASSDWTARKASILNNVQTYNTALNTYLFEDLVNTMNAKFSDAKMEKRIQTLSKNKRQSVYDDSFVTWSDGWKSYAELITAQDEARADNKFYTVEGKFKGYEANIPGNASDNGNIISEVCAISFKDNVNSADFGKDWKKGGRCYYAK